VSKYKLTKPALADMQEIWEYIAADNVEAAASWTDEIDEKFHLLVTRPYIGRTRDELRNGIWGLLYGSYIIFYMIKGKRIIIMRIIHGSRDISNITFTTHPS